MELHALAQEKGVAQAVVADGPALRAGRQIEEQNFERSPVDRREQLGQARLRTCIVGDERALPQFAIKSVLDVDCFRISTGRWTGS